MDERFKKGVFYEEYLELGAYSERYRSSSPERNSENEEVRGKIFDGGIDQSVAEPARWSL
jgi:hypothetical protein